MNKESVSVINTTSVDITIEKKAIINGIIARGVGRHKTSVAKVAIKRCNIKDDDKDKSGTGKYIINGKSILDYWGSPYLFNKLIKRPLELIDTVKGSNLQSLYDIIVVTYGGGYMSQAKATRLGISKALLDIDSSYRDILVKEKLLTRDSRKKESKKYGLKKARKAPQYRKR